jgi:hypothetical protein
MPEPGLRPSTGVNRLRRYHEPLRLPQRPKADHFRPPGWWTRPTTTMDLARCLENLVRMLTPLPRLERTSSRVGCSPVLQRPSPSGRRVGSSEKLSRPAQGSTSFRPAHLHLGCAKDFPGGSSGRSLASTAPVATGRTDNSPDGTYTRWPSRPRRSLRQLNSAHVRSPFRAALPVDSLAEVPVDSLALPGTPHPARRTGSSSEDSKRAAPRSWMDAASGASTKAGCRSYG